MNSPLRGERVFPGGKSFALGSKHVHFTLKQVTCRSVALEKGKVLGHCF